MPYWHRRARISAGVVGQAEVIASGWLAEYAEIARGIAHCNGAEGVTRGSYEARSRGDMIGDTGTRRNARESNWTALMCLRHHHETRMSIRCEVVADAG